MHWHLNPYALILTLSALVSGAIAIYAWRRRPAVGAAPLAVLMLGAAIWSLGYAAGIGMDDLAAKILWAKVQHLGVGVVPLAMLVLVLQYTGQGKWLTWPRLAPLALVPAIGVLLAWTNEAHGLIWAEVELFTQGSVSHLQLQYGVYFWLYAAYNYLLLFTATLLLVRTWLHSSILQRRQTAAILVGALFPWLGNFMYLTGLNPFPHLDLTPFAYTLTGLAAAWALLRYHLLDIIPVARDKVVESMSDALIVLDAQGRIVDINSATQALIHRSLSEVFGQPLERISVRQSNRPAQELGKILAELCRDAVQANTQVAVGREGAQRYYDFRLSSLYTRRRELTGNLIILRDVTERKQAEEALREREQFLALLSDITRAALGTPDLSTMLQILADRLGELFGADGCYLTLWDEATRIPILAAAYGEWKARYELVHLEPRELTVPESVLNAGHPLVIEDVYDTQFLSPGIAELFPDRSLLGLPLIADNQRLGVALIAFNTVHHFTPEEVMRAEQAAAQIALAVSKAQLVERLQEYVVELQARNEELDAFAHSVAHDLKSPLHLIVGYAELLQEECASMGETTLQEFFHHIRRAGNTMSSIIDELLLLASVRKMEEVDVEPLDMAIIVAAAQDRLADLIEEHQAEILTGDDWPVALGRGAWVEEVWVNYVSNAIKYGGRPPRVELGASLRDGGTIRFWVRDNGPGLAAEEQAFLFTPFERLQQVRAEGHGLGLSIVQRIVEKLGGDVGVECEEGQGCVFWFELPGSEEA